MPKHKDTLRHVTLHTYPHGDSEISDNINIQYGYPCHDDLAKIEDARGWVVGQTRLQI